MGFFAALSFMRSLSSAFDWHMSFIYGTWFNFGPVVSPLLFGASMAALTYAIWQTKTPKNALPHRKIDFSLLVLYCIVGFFMCYSVLLGNMITPWEILRFDTAQLAIMGWIPFDQTYVILVPMIAYTIALFAYAELLARLRDKTLISTLYWLTFYKTYRQRWPIWLSAFLLLASQLYLLFLGFPTLIMTLSIITISALTYFAVFLLNLSADFYKANEDKVRAERFKSELITNVSHDIKTPLTSIINYVDLLKSENLQGQAAGHVAVLDKKSARLKVLIDDLMEASKASTGNMRVDMQEINLSELVGQVAGEFEDSFNGRDLTLVIRQPDSPILINSDSRHLYRTLENLFSNAAKYSLTGTRIFAETAPQDGKVLFTLQNTAQNPMELSGQDVTEQFIRGDMSRHTEGSGLGLYIAKSLVELMGGEMHISILGDLFRVEISL